QSVFPAVFEIAKENNNLILGFLKKLFQSTTKEDKGKKRKREIISFPEGLSTLVRAIHKFLPVNKVKLNSPVKKLFLHNSLLVVELADGQCINAKKVILAVPAFKAAEIAPEIYKDLSKLRYASVSCVNLICDEKYFSEDNLKTISSSFGFLTARDQDIQVLGVIFSSALFSNRCSKGQIAFTCFVGGINNPQALNLSDKEITDLCLRDIKKVFHLDSLQQEFSLVTKWQQGIPQYEVGHKALIEAVEPSMQGIVLAGNYLRGVSVEDSVKSGFEAYKEVNLRKE
ncbi:MAG: protoporphyrinogen oxidase, partial [Candidatus Caenarcaniphilales bacterium]|nr:protoporphyrinogen oxidase [Candidatus Caenarcaniphilales bacterium]